MPTAGSLFSGIGGIDLAFSQAGFDVRWQVENEAFCRAVLKKHAPTYWPNSEQFEDVHDVGKRELETVDVIFGGFPCFPAGTLVLTMGGYRPIEELAKGDVVLTHLGTWEKITATMQHDEAPLREVHIQSTLPIYTTDEHPFWVREYRSKWQGGERTHRREFDAPKWVEAKSLTKGCLASQVLPPVVIDYNSADFWWLVGRYLADGWRRERKDRNTDSGRVIICANHDEAGDLEERIARAGYAGSREVQRTVTRFHITKNDFYRFLEPFGKGAKGKTLPGWCLSLRPEKAEALLLGYLTGDGSRYKQKGVEAGWKATTVSKTLAMGMALLAQRAWGIVASVFHYRVNPQTVIEGRTVNQSDQYHIQIPDRNRSNFVEEQYGWKRVKSSEPSGEIATVFNITVAGANSYIVGNTCVHNCQDISIAGQRAGIQAGNRSGLWFEFARIIGELRPQVVLLENVTNITAAGMGGPVVIGDLTEMGYDCIWMPVRASDVGAPHRRERWFCVAYRDSDRAYKLNKSQQHDAANGNQKVSRQSLADATSVRQQGHRADAGSISAGKRKGRVGQPARGGASVADAQEPRLSQRRFGHAQNGSAHRKAAHVRTVDRPDRLHGYRRNARQRTVHCRSRHAQPGLGGGVTRFSAQLDGHLWPAGPGQAQHEWEPPRLASGVKDRTKRIRALGNAVVPQQVFPLAVAIREWLEAGERMAG